MKKRHGITHLAIVALALAAAGCHGIEPNPTSPSTARSPIAPTAIQIVIMPGELPIGGGTADVLISTTAGAGSIVSPAITVRLSVDGGELSSGEVTTDSTGHARLTWTGTSNATVTAASGAISSTAAIKVNVPFVPPPQPPPTLPPPRPTPEPLPPQPTPPPALSVTVSANPQQVQMGLPTTLTAQVSNLQAGETVLAYQWDWEGGTTFSADETTAGNSRQHIYVTDGVKTPVVLVQTSSGRTASASTRVFVVKP